MKENKPIRILQYIGSLHFGGSQSMIMGVYRKTDRSKVQFDFVVWPESRDGWYDVVEQLGGRIYVSPKYTGKNHFAYLRWWRTFFADHPEYKVIHGHVRSTATLYLSVANHYGLVTIAHSHSTSNGTGFAAVVKNIMQLPIRCVADYLFACSNQAGAWLYGRAALKKANYQRIPNGIDLTRFAFDLKKREQMRTALHIPDNVYVVGHVGRFTKPKNHVWLVNLFAEWQKTAPNSCLLLVGDGEGWNNIRQQCEKLGISDKVIMPGGSSAPEDYYQAMDVFAFPSLWEGLPMSVVEAQANGLPCLISETITPEVKLTNLVHTLPLNDTNAWIKGLSAGVSNHRGAVSPSQYGELQAFDINTVAQALQTFYLQHSEKS